MDTQSEELARLRHEVQQAEHLVACFRQATAHDLPNHLVAIQGLARLLDMEEKERLSPAGQEYLRRLTGVMQRVEGLVRTLAEICRIGREQFPTERLPLGVLAEEAAAEINQLFRGRVIEYHFPQSPFFVTATRPDLRRVLVQLMRNAVQACPEGRPARIEIGARETPAQKEFWVADQGRGIALEQRSQLQQFLSGQLSKSPGNGLGLVLVRRIVDQWRGRIRMESEQGQGTIFTITFDAAKEQ